MFLLGRDNTRVDLGLRTGQYTRGIAPRGRRVGYTHSGGWGTHKKMTSIHAWRVFLARRVEVNLNLHYNTTKVDDRKYTV